MNILLVEDNPGDARLVQEYLRDANFIGRLDIVDRLRVGLDHVQENEVDLVLLDLSLPDSYGFETFERFKNEYPVMPLVVLSGMSDERLAIQAVQAGAQDYLVKGQISDQLLIRTLKHAIERQRLVIEREQLIHDLNAFAHTVAHDLKSPLALVIGYLDYIVDQFDQITDQQKLSHVKATSEYAQKTSSIIESLLLLSSVHGHEVENTALKMPEIVAGALERHTLLIEERQAQITLPDSWPVALGYGPWVEEVWANYISNALKYGGNPPLIELGATVEGDTVCFWITDNGPGISPEEARQVFAEFTRLASAGQVAGHGLGLSIVQRIVNKLGGDVGVESEPGKGSRFYFTLPL